MPKGEAVYYVGRVVKTGFTTDQFINALFEPKPYLIENDIWTISDCEKFDDTKYLYYRAELNRAKPETQLTVLSDNMTRKIEKDEPRVVIGTSEFIYIPEYSGIAFRSIPIHIEPKAFMKYFQRIIEDTLGILFVECEIQMIDNIQGFMDKLKTIDKITSIKTRVKPPNPLFGELWESLKNYLESRKTEELHFKEISKNNGLLTDIKYLIRLILEGNKEKIDEFLKTHVLSAVDLSVLMSLDGYGEGRIDGFTNDKHVFIKTHEKLIHFSLPDQHETSQVYDEASQILLEVNNERYLKH